MLGTEFGNQKRDPLLYTTLPVKEGGQAVPGLDLGNPDRSQQHNGPMTVFSDNHTVVDSRAFTYRTRSA